MAVEPVFGFVVTVTLDVDGLLSSTYVVADALCVSIRPSVSPAISLYYIDCLSKFTKQERNVIGMANILVALSLLLCSLNYIK